MEQLYAEAGCKPKKGTKEYLITGAVGVGALICAYFILLSGQIILSMIGLAGVVAIIFLYPRLNVEYEYIFCDGQFDFDKIMGGNKRKTVLKIDMENVEIIGPAKAAELTNFRDIKVSDFSSGNAEANVYAIIVKVGEKNIKILFEPTARMIEAMKMKSPRKVLKSW